MPTFTKDVLYPGTYRLGDGRRVSYSRADVKHLSQRLKDMIAAGLHIPAAWEHQNDSRPMTDDERRASRARHNLGFALDAEESPDGFLVTRLDVPNEDDAKRLPSVRFVSPEISEDFVDGNGRLWEGKSLTHIAITAHPVRHDQQPFQPARLSVVRLSLVDRLGEEDMADEKTNGSATSKSGDALEGNGGPSIKDALADLAGYGIVLPDDTSEANFLDRLVTALKALKGQAGGGEGDLGDLTEAPISETEVPPVAMSLEKRLKAAETRLVDMERSDIKRRIGRLYESGRIGKPLRDKLLGECGKVRLSLGAQGTVAPNVLTARVEAYEELDQGTAWPPGSRMSLERNVEREAPPPASQSGRPESPAEVDRALQEWDRAMGRGSSRKD